MHGRTVRGVAALGALIVVSGATAAAVELGRNDSTSAVAAAADMPSAEVLKYWSDARSALSPLLLYVRILPETVNALERKDGRAKAGELRQAKDMADSFATARDLVGRLPVPATVTGNVSELLQVACQLYRQAALEVAGMNPNQAGAPSLAALQRANALHLIADRLIDQTRRVLNIDAATAVQAPIELRYAPPVPSLAEVTGVAAGVAETSVEDALKQAHGLLATQAEPVALTKAAAALEHADAHGEDVVGARLAILLALVADETESAPALHMLSVDVWNTARTLVQDPHATIGPLPAIGEERKRVWRGGAFDGKPPALKPGENVGSGLPGGLPNIDPVQILKG